MTKKYTPLSDRCREIILGSLLGDGSIALNKRYKNARFSFKHSSKYLEYFNWKVSEMSEISSDRSNWLQKNDGYGLKKLRYQSRALENLTEIYNLIAKKGKKVVRRKWLNMMSPLSLAVWWCDDGSLISDTRTGVFCTDGFSRSEVVLLDEYLKKVWNIETKLGKQKGRNRSEDEYWRLYIRSSGELQKFLRIILPYIPVEEMLYKVLILYKDSELQQRWISEVSQLTVFDRETIQRVVSQRKVQLKCFRE